MIDFNHSIISTQQMSLTDLIGHLVCLSALQAMKEALFLTPIMSNNSRSVLQMQLVNGHCRHSISRPVLRVSLVLLRSPEDFEISAIWKFPESINPNLNRNSLHLNYSWYFFYYFWGYVLHKLVFQLLFPYFYLKKTMAYVLLKKTEWGVLCKI